MHSGEGEEPSASTLDSELYFLISRFLEVGPCKDAAQALRREIEEHQLLPKRNDWEGNEHSRSFQNLLEINRHIPPDHLSKLCKRIGPLLDKEVKPSVPGVQSLLGTGKQSLLRTKEGSGHTSWPSAIHSVLRHGQPMFPPKNLLPLPNLAHIISSRQLTGTCYHPHAVQCKNIYSKLSMHSRTLGHLSAVYCVAFDKTGRYIFTGADDHLVKVWSAMDGRLLATLRGHSAEITDMAINHENTMLATGGCDKVVRVWCLKTCSPVAVLTGHTGVITSVQFCPLVRTDVRFLASTGADGCVCFWQFNVAKKTFDPKPIKFLERSRAGAQMLCSSFSAGGVFLATGSTDHVVRVYCFLSAAPEKICELEAHTDRVDSIAYSMKGDRFLSGSKDGTARIWRYDRQEWKAIILNMNTKLNSAAEPPVSSEMRPSKPKVTMVGWSMNDSYVVTAVNDYTLRVWNSHNGNLLHVLHGHEDEVFVLDSNPMDERIMLSAGHDGNMIIWDIESGTLIKSFFNMIEGQGHGSIFDCKFRRDGQSIVATDSHGHLLLFGFGSSESYQKVPTENFFHTDYRPLIRDANNYVLDEQTQQPPHLMPPPFLVDIDGNPHPPKYQKLVPGRENCSMEQLTPQMVETPSGDREVVDEPVVQEDDRPHNLDEAIQMLQRRQDNRQQNEEEEEVLSPMQSPRSLRSPVPFRRNRSESAQSPGHSRVGMRWNGEVEGVRQASGNIVSQTATNNELQAKKLRTVVRDMDKAVLGKNQEWRQCVADEEIRRYFSEKKKRPVDFVDQDSDSGSYITTRKRTKNKQISHNYRTRATRNDTEQTSRNRLTTRALYDTEEEDEGLSDDDTIIDSDPEPWNNNGNDDSESSEFSDWAADAGMNLQPPKRSSRVPKKKVIHSPNEDGGESSQSRRKQQPRRNKQKKQLINSHHTITELPDEFRPPEWLTDTIPRKAPYVPQMGDEVMYFRQGHEQYVQAVKTHNVYEINPNKNQPWHKLTNLREQELVKVTGIKYEIRPPRLCCIKLGFVDPVNGKLTGSYFSIKYHDMPDVIDFLVLKQNYDTAMQRNWKPGDRFRSMIDDAWWMGKIESQEPYQEIFPDSMYQCFNVQWDNGEIEKLSPWDMEPILPRRVPRELGGSDPVTQEELKSLMYSPNASEWPSGSREDVCDRIIHCIEQLMEYRIAEPFLTPVDLTAFPIYAMVIEYPIDLSTIKGRLENNYYRRITALQFDVRLLASNTEKFNQAGTPIVKWAHIITDILLRFISEPELTDVHSAYVEATDGNDLEEGEDDDDNEPSTTKKKKTSDRGGKKTETQDPEAWRDQCQQLLTTILECDDSQPFRNPVDPIDFPDYHELIDSPMDLSSIKEEWDCGNYNSPTEFAKDMQLIFANSRQYNTNKRSRIYTMTLRLKALFDEHVRSILADYKSVSKGSTSSSRKETRTSRRAETSSASFFPNTRRRPPKPQMKAVAVSSPSKSRLQAGSSRSGRSQGSHPGSSTRGQSGHTSGSLRLKFSNVPKRKHESTAESSGDDGEGYSVRRSNRSKTSVTNGHGNYTTRRSTGSLKRRHYHEFETTTSDDEEPKDNEDEEEVEVDDQEESEAEEVPTTRLSKNKDVPTANGHSKYVTRKNALKKETVEHSSDEDSSKSDSDKSESGSSSSSGSDDSGSSSNEESENEDDGDDDVRRSRRATTRHNTKASQSFQTRGSGKRAIKSRHLYSEEFEEPKVRTRNRGKQIVKYVEESDDESKVQKHRRKRKVSDDVSEVGSTRGGQSGDESQVRTSRRGKQTVQYAEESDDEINVRLSKRGKRTMQFEEDSDNELPVRPSKRGKQTVQYAEDSDDESEAEVRTRNRGKQTVKYKEDSEEDDEPTVSMSSRGRIRRMTPRAKASLMGV